MVRTLESRKFRGPGGALLWLRLIFIGEGEPFGWRVVMRGRVRGGTLAACESEELARQAFERHCSEARKAGWSSVPKRLRLALEVPAPAPIYVRLPGKHPTPKEAEIATELAGSVAQNDVDDDAEPGLAGAEAPAPKGLLSGSSPCDTPLGAASRGKAETSEPGSALWETKAPPRFPAPPSQRCKPFASKDAHPALLGVQPTPGHFLVCPECGIEVR